MCAKRTEELPAFSDPHTLTEITKIVATHANLTARYDGLSFLRNALTTANAGFSQALVQAGSGNAESAQLMMKTSEETLSMAIAAWRSIDGGDGYYRK